MAITVSAVPQFQLTYTLTETSPSTFDSLFDSVGSATSSESTIGGSKITFSDGTGTGAVNMGAELTGTLPSGGSIDFNITSFEKSSYGVAGTVDFSSGVKAITVVNTYSGGLSGWPASGYSPSDMPRLTLSATGVSGYSGLFNADSGNLALRPYSTFAFSDYVGIPVVGDQKVLTLTDLDGSGCSYEITVVGVATV